MARVLFDTTVLIDALRGCPAAARMRGLRLGGDVCYVCIVNVEEVVRGLRPPERGSALRLLHGLRLAPLSHAEGVQAGDWRQTYARMGTTLSQADCLIGAAARAVGARLATGNPKDFPMPELDVEHWPVGV
ncbi:MAG: PIN domain-containing protein [Acidimicrobiales bacterium]